MTAGFLQTGGPARGLAPRSGLLAAAARAGLLAAAALAAAPAARAQDDGNPFLNIFKYGGTTKPPEAPPSPDSVYCPVIEVAEGKASLQTLGGTGVRTQVRLGQLSRACTPGPNGTTLVSVGVEGRALLGPGGSPGRFEAPFTVTLKHGTVVIARRARRAAVTIPPGEANASFAIVEDGFSVPAAYVNDFDIEVGLGGSAGKAPRAPRRKPAASAGAAE
ncbi:hypothetical protein [Methylobacterium crusticola]|uniref:hypothetical protein n=1 Tax=Methylobacterium crusticola TaxID=1697972 RepID=UPI001EE3057F|nr:hypothetical protein [Methylobacterium crusticola]